MAVAVDGSGTAFGVGGVQPLFETSIRLVGFGGASATNYDVSPDGQRFLVLTTPDSSALAPITIVSPESATDQPKLSPTPRPVSPGDVPPVLEALRYACWAMRVVSWACE